MKPGTLLIRADENSEIGSGHVLRCLALAQAWRDSGGACIFLVHSPSQFLADRIRCENLELISCSAFRTSLADAENVLRIASERNSEWLVLDGYGFQSEYQSFIQPSGRRVMLIDDYGRLGSHCANLVLDQNFGATESPYPKRLLSTKLLLGTSYTLLRKEFLNSDQMREVPGNAKRILVTMGGSDPENFTELVIRALGSALQSQEITVVVVLGGNNQHRQAVQRAVRECLPSAQVASHTNHLSDLIADSDLAIIAAGNTLWEMLHMGCPVLSFARNEIQDRILRLLQDQGALCYIDQNKIRNVPDVAEEIGAVMDCQSMRKRMRAEGRGLVDGKGAQRVCQVMKDIN